MGNKTFFRKAESGTLGYRDIFSDVFRHHTQDETARMFISGTSLTTPSEAEMLTSWTKPYAFLRCFVIGLLSLLALYCMADFFGSDKSLAVLLTFIPCLVPFSCLLLVWELHVPRNIPIYEVFLMVLTGGVLSLFATLLINWLLFVIGGIGLEDRWAGLVEEPAKLIAVYFFLGRKEKKRNYILNGLLIGFAVGTGFSFMESIGYTFTKGGLATAMVRAGDAFAGHAMWASMYGAALAEEKGEEELSIRHLFSGRVILYFIVAVLLHFFHNSVWFLPVIKNVPLVDTIYVQSVLLTLISFIIWLPLVRRGVNQIVRISIQANGGLTKAVYGGGAAPEQKPQEIYRPQQPVQPEPVPTPHPDEIWYLLGTGGNWSGRKIDLKGRMRLLVGRDPKRASVVMENCPRVSGLHCELYFDGQRLTVKDLNSMNGTFLGRQRVQPQAETEVPEGSEIFFGDKTCSFRFVRESRRVPYHAG